MPERQPEVASNTQGKSQYFPCIHQSFPLEYESTGQEGEKEGAAEEKDEGRKGERKREAGD